ncbi:MAG TPA: lytic transglycosylase domain-containing protein [Myxococcales bacterium]|jgi:soluble lytic murein transglycosylase-like protein|nr:lytic transglycosylase domain-containing protein [Myxococcales bacterium]
MSTEATATATVPSEPPAPPHALLSLPAVKLPAHVQPWTAALVGFLALALFGATVAGIYFKLKLDALGSNAAVAARQTTQLLEQVAALDAQERAIRAEGTELRQYIASNSAEQIIFLKMLVLKPDLDTTLAHTIAKHVHYYAALYKRDPDLVLSIIAEESRFNPNATSPVGALGLMQVMPQWEKVLGIQGSLKDPEVSIKYGLQVLGFYMEMYKDIEMALTAYNRGPGPVDMALMHGKDPKNKYAPEVLRVYERLKKLGLKDV